MTALVTLKTMADQQSAWGSLLKVVLVLGQCMRTVLVAVQQSLLGSFLPSLPLLLARVREREGEGERENAGKTKIAISG